MIAKHSSQLKKAYAQAAKGYNQVNLSNLDLKNLQPFIQLLRPNTTILDLGGGTGRDSKYFLSQDFQVTLLDNSPEMLVFAKKNASGAQFLEADMADVQLTPESYDGIWANASLLNLTKSEFKAVLQKLHKALKKNGVLFIKVKSGEGEEIRIESHYTSKTAPIQRFFTFYQENELTDLLEEQNFTIVNRHTYFSKNQNQNWIAILSQKQN